MIQQETRRFWIDWHPDWGFWMLYVPAGTDPTDGMPLTLARCASPYEIQLWQEQRLTKLEQHLRLQGVMVPQVLGVKKPSWLRRLFRRKRR